VTKRIFRAICIVALSVFLAALVLIMGALYRYFSQVQKNQLRMQTELAAHAVEDQGVSYFEGFETEDYRITWVDNDGTVLYDSKSDSNEMENHLEREEIKEALEDGYGESSRYSSTLMERSLYAAQRLEDNTVLRVSIAQSTVLTLVLGMAQPICIVIIVAFVLSFVLASGLSKKIVKPLNELNLDDPLSNDDYDELSPLLRRIDSQQKQLREQALELNRKQDEFDAVTMSMNEGIILVNDKGKVLSINRAAANLLETDKSCIWQDILTINRTLEIQELLEKALNGESAEKIVELSGGEYQVDVSPVTSEDSVSGAVVLIFDVTEKERSEQIRREFTANVSHELKTPLHSISGYAELLTNGMVKPEHIGQFSEKIYSEAQRMIRLVEDIIHLSQLDEGASTMKYESVDLYNLAKENVHILSAAAEEAKVKLLLTGESVTTKGIPQLISGIIYNLCDNAIKYNRENGTVLIDVSSDNEGVCLSVADTGIGVPAEHQSRIFERFYRIDKSHSKEVGGTGLGLSIVKHAAKIHDAKIELHSVVNEGTTITVYFPK